MHENTHPRARAEKSIEEISFAPFTCQNNWVMVWHTRSPDLNHIEHMWDVIRRAVRGRLRTPETL